MIMKRGEELKIGMQSVIRVVSLTVVALSLVITLSCLVLTASAAQMSVLPAYQEVLTGENFTVDIYIDPEGSEVFCAQYELHFNNSLVNGISQDKGPFFGDTGVYENKNEINNTLGWAKYGATRTALPGVTTPGVLATITFQAIADDDGLSELNFTIVKLGDPGIVPIPTDGNNGSVNVRTGICGDVDGSGKVDMADYFLLVDYIAEVPGRILDSEWAGDVDCSGKVDMADYFLLVDYIAEVPGRDLVCCSG